MSPRVVACVLNYNGKELTLQAVESLLGMSYDNFGILVVDNGSEDDSHEAVQAAFPQVDALRIEHNRGVAHGLNAGVVHALGKSPDYLLLLNNDIEVDPEMLTEMVRVAESDASIGCVGPKAFYYWDRDIIWSAGGILRFKESVTRERGNGVRDDGRFDRDEEVDYVNGCAMLLRSSVVRQVGLFDPIFHLAVEDADWCMRMKRAGYRCYYAHRAVLWHMVSMSTGVYKPGRTFQTGRSTALFVRRYGGPLQWLSFLFFITLALPVAFVRELFKGNQAAAVSKLRGVIAGLRARMTPPPELPDGQESR